MAGDDKPAEVGEGKKPEAAREGAAGRNRNRNRRANRSGTTSSAMTKKESFTGRVVGLTGYIYDCSDNRQSEQFVRTTKEISMYVGREFARGGDDVRIAVDTFSLPIIPKPPRPADATKDLDKLEWSGELKAWQARMTNLEEGMKRLYNTVFAQCSETMVQRLVALDNYESDILSKSDAIALLTAIKRISFNFQSQKFEPQSICEAMRQFYAYRQGAQPRGITRIP
jgi:hypothetical protein